MTFDVTKYTEHEMSVSGINIRYRAYEDIVYVANPVDRQHQVMNIYIPSLYFSGKSINGYTASTAPIFFPNFVGGYMPSEPGRPDKAVMGQGANAIFAALAHGFVVASPGTRGRVSKNQEGKYTGKAPACIVDLKAAVRYLRHNDKIMPGDAEKIIANGTSAGGAISALLGASGNSSDYAPYLEALGAANERDDVYAASCYCPITNLERADMAYEWQFSGVNTYSKIVFEENPDRHIERKTITGQLDTRQIDISEQLKALFPAYINSLGLIDQSGMPLTLDSTGNGGFKDYLMSFVAASAQKALDKGFDLSRVSWLTVANGKVTSVNFIKYVQYMARMKTPPAFDALDLSSGENSLFGTETEDARHFTQFSKNHGNDHAQMADASLVQMMNPMTYLQGKTSSVAKFWRIRHGTVDKDTSLAIPAILATKLKNNGFQVDFALAWDRPHSGDYDLDELILWIDAINRNNASPTSS